MRIFDPAGQKHDFTANPPTLSDCETHQAATHDAKHWKKVHKLTEQIFSIALDLQDTLHRYSQDEASRLLDRAHTHLERHFGELKRLPDSVKEAGLIDFLIRAQICFNALFDHLVSPVGSTAQAAQLCGRLRQWFYHALVAADSMLEEYFRKMESN